MIYFDRKLMISIIKIKINETIFTFYIKIIKMNLKLKLEVFFTI